MRRNIVTLAWVLGFLGFGPALLAQSTGTPVALAPVRAFENSTLGVTLSDPGRGVAFEGWYGMVLGRNDVTFRAGFWDAKGSTPFLIGVDARAPLVEHTESFPLDGALTVGAGGSFTGDFSVFFVPIGFTMGRKLEIKDSDIRIQPYGEPILTVAFGDVGDNVLLSLGLGFEIQFSNQFALDVSGMLGDLDGISVGFAYLR